jgi:hypothetical protein
MILESPDAFTPSAGAFGADTGSLTAGAVTFSAVVLGVSLIRSSQALEYQHKSNAIARYRNVELKAGTQKRRVLQGSGLNLGLVARKG